MLVRKLRVMATLMESMELRRLFAVSAAVIDGVLTVDGDAFDNGIEIVRVGKQLRVNALDEVTGVWSQVHAAADAAVSTIIVNGLGGDDSLTVASSVADQYWLYGGEGDDWFHLNGSATARASGDNGEDTFFPGNHAARIRGGTDASVDKVTYENATSAVYLDLSGMNKSGPRFGTRKHTMLEIEWGIASEFNDYLTGSTRTDTLQGLAGDDEIHGVGGDDHLWGDEDNDTIHGGAGADTISSSFGDDSLLGDSGNDFIDASDDDDTIIGGSGADTIYAGAGNDLIDSRDGAINDEIHGHTGYDIALIDFGGPMTDEIIDVELWGT